MPALHTYDYAVLRVVPRVDRGEFVNAGVILSCSATRWLKAVVRLDPVRVRMLDPAADLDMIARALAAIERVCAGDAAAGEIARLPVRQRFHWLAAPRSTIIQTSPVHTGQCEDLDTALAALVRRLVDVPTPDGPMPNARTPYGLGPG